MADLVSFDDIKGLVGIEEVADWLGVKTFRQGAYIRAPFCPFCQEKRAFTLTPEKQLFGCFRCQKKGNIFHLVHHLKRGISTKPTPAEIREAAVLIQEHFLGTVSSPEAGDSKVPAEGDDEGDSIVPPAAKPPPEARQDAPQSPLKPLEHLATNHPAIEVLGLTPGACTAIGIGYTSKGMMRGRVAIPLRLEDGTLVGYLGIATTIEQQPLLLFPKNLEDRCTAPAPAAAAPEPSEPKKPADELRKMFRVVA